MADLQTPAVRRERDLLWFFDLALILKAIDGGLEMLGALLVLFVPPALVVQLAEYVTSGELATDPGDPVANLIREAAHSFAVHTHILIALYLALHGLVKVLLVIGILARKRIAYPLFMGALALFGAYEAYRGILTGSWFLEALAVFDIVLLFLTAHEYRQRYPAVTA